VPDAVSSMSYFTTASEDSLRRTLIGGLFLNNAVVLFNLFFSKSRKKIVANKYTKLIERASHTFDRVSGS